MKVSRTDISPAPATPPPETAPGTADPTAILCRNLAALFATNLKLARRLDALPDSDLPPLEPTRSGAWTLATPDASGKPQYLHSRHDPRDEARRLVRSAPLEGKLCFAVHGAGLGYHVAVLLEAVARDTLTLVFESDLPTLRRALECVDLSQAILRRRVEFITEPTRDALFTAIGLRMVLLSMGLATVSHAPSTRRDPAFYSACSKLITDFASFSRTSLNTLVINGKKTAENIARNAGWYAAAGRFARLRKRHAGRPAIIVSAGPSLRKNQHLLREASGRAVLIAVQTTLKPLLAMGVTPDYVTSLDYHDICARFFEGLPEGLATELIAEPKATELVMRMHTGPVSLVGNDFADSLLREMGLDRPRLSAGATVAHLAFYAAEFLGCDPILFVGQDLGFSDGMCYAPGTSYDDVWRPELSRFTTLEMKQWEQIAREKPILRRIADVSGNPMYTEERLFSYLQQFERDFAATRAKVIDCTEGGALKRGATPMPLREALDRFCRENLPPVDEPAPTDRGLDHSRRAEVAACLQKRAEEAEEIASIARQTLPLLEEIRAHLEDQPRVNRAIARVDTLRAQMNALGATYDLVTQLTQETELRRFEMDMKLAAERELDGLSRQRRQVERDLINCRAIASAAVEFVGLMRQCQARLEAMPSVADTASAPVAGVEPVARSKPVAGAEPAAVRLAGLDQGRAESQGEAQRQGRTEAA